MRCTGETIAILGSLLLAGCGEGVTAPSRDASVSDRSFAGDASARDSAATDASAVDSTLPDVAAPDGPGMDASAPDRTFTCSGTLVGGFCWYKGNLGESCTTARPRTASALSRRE